MNIKKNVLIISPFFYPFAGVGANRMTWLAREILGKFNVFVMQENPENYKSKYFDESEGFYSGIEHIYCEGAGGFLSRGRIYEKKVFDFLSEEAVDTVIISVGPFYPFSFVHKIKKKYKNIKVILDVRDFWSKEPVNKEFSLSLKDKFSSFLKFHLYEKKAMKYADFIVVMGEQEKEYLLKFYDKNFNKKIKVIPNGYDMEKLKNIHFTKATVENEKDKGFNLICYGKLATYLSDRQIEAFSRALSRAKKHIPELRFIHIGGEEKLLGNAMEKAGIDYIAEGYMPYGEGVEKILVEGSVCVVSSDLGNLGMGTKVYDYIYCNKPILYIGEKTDAIAKYISNFENGFIGNNAEDISDALVSIFDNNLKCLSRDIDVKKYSRQYHTEKYIDII